MPGHKDDIQSGDDIKRYVANESFLLLTWFTTGLYLAPSRMASKSCGLKLLTPMLRSFPWSFRSSKIFHNFFKSPPSATKGLWMRNKLGTNPILSNDPWIKLITSSKGIGARLGLPDTYMQMSISERRTSYALTFRSDVYVFPSD